MTQRIGYVFPGQGSQIVGMGRSFSEQFPVARETFREADEILGWPVSRLCWEGPEEDLQLTANTQPALLATSVAIQRVIAERGMEPVPVQPTQTGLAESRPPVGIKRSSSTVVASTSTAVPDGTCSARKPLPAMTQRLKRHTASK